MLPCAVVALAVCGCGGGSAPQDGDAVAALVPPDTPFFAEAIVRPDAERAQAITELAASIAGVDDPAERLITQLDRELGAQLSYEKDVEPWLGDHAAIFVRSLESGAVTGMGDGALIVETTDPDAAEKFIEEAATSGDGASLRRSSYKEVDYMSVFDSAGGVIGDHLVWGTEDSFKAAVDAWEGESLADSEHFTELGGGLGDEHVAEMWIDLGTALDVAAYSAEADGPEIEAARAAFGPLLDEPVMLELAVTEDMVTLDTSAAGGPVLNGDTELLASLPSTAWLGVAIADTGEAVSQTLAGLGAVGEQVGRPTLDAEGIAKTIRAESGLDLEDDILSWARDGAAYIAGDYLSGLELGTVLDSADPKASAAAIAGAQRALERTIPKSPGPPSLDDADAGFRFQAPLGPGLEIAQRDDRVVTTLGAISGNDVLEPPESLGETQLFDTARDALGDEYGAVAFLELEQAVAVAERADTVGYSSYEELLPYASAFSYLIWGTATEDGRLLSRFAIGIEE